MLGKNNPAETEEVSERGENAWGDYLAWVKGDSSPRAHLIAAGSEKKKELDAKGGSLVTVDQIRGQLEQSQAQSLEGTG